MVYCIDIDGTICSQTEPPYDRPPVPFFDRIRKVNCLYEEGHTVILHTGRHWNHLHITLNQLAQWGVKYHTLTMGKPVADIYVDDRAIDDIDFFERMRDDR